MRGHRWRLGGEALLDGCVVERGIWCYDYYYDNSWIALVMIAWNLAFTVVVPWLGIHSSSDSRACRAMILRGA